MTVSRDLRTLYCIGLGWLGSYVIVDVHVLTAANPPENVASKRLWGSSGGWKVLCGRWLLSPSGASFSLSVPAPATMPVLVRLCPLMLWLVSEREFVSGGCPSSLAERALRRPPMRNPTCISIPGTAGSTPHTTHGILRTSRVPTVRSSTGNPGVMCVDKLRNPLAATTASPYGTQTAQ